jgi:hypothetical protein
MSQPARCVYIHFPEILNSSFTGTLIMLPIFVAAIVPALAEPSPTPDRAHPIITEILYAVPTGPAGDADQDGNRSATGDEFIEIFNAGEKPINLEGYRLMDGLPTQGKAATDEKSHIDFTFPKATLAPKQTAVIFNGFGSTPKGEVGDATAAKAANDNFHGALVFSMKCNNQYQALSNSNDMVVLLAPDGTALQCVRWDNRDDEKREQANRSRRDTSGKNSDSTKSGSKNSRNNSRSQPADKAAPEAARVTQDAPKSTGSVTLTTIEGEFTPHMDQSATLFSPGQFPAAPAADAAKSDPAGKASETKTTEKPATKPATSPR